MFNRLFTTHLLRFYLHFVAVILFVVISLCEAGAQNYNEKHISVDVFLSSPLGESVGYQNIKRQFKWFSKVTKEVIKSNHSTDNDTIIRFKMRKSILIFYKSQYSEFLYGGTVENKKIKFVGNIHVGMKQDDFFDAFKKLNSSHIKNNVLKIVDSDNTSSCSFTFKNGKLKKIEYKSYFD